MICPREQANIPTIGGRCRTPRPSRIRWRPGDGQPGMYVAEPVTITTGPAMASLAYPTYPLRRPLRHKRARFNALST